MNEEQKKKNDALKYLGSLGLDALVEDVPSILEGERLVLSWGEVDNELMTNWSIWEEE